VSVATAQIEGTHAAPHVTTRLRPYSQPRDATEGGEEERCNTQSTFETSKNNGCNIRLKVVETLETCFWNTWKHLWNTLENHCNHTQHPSKHTCNICMKHMQHLDKYNCNMRPEKHKWNIRLKHSKHTIATCLWKQLQHMEHVQHLPIYFYNIHMVQLQHTSKTSRTIETCNCNIGEREPNARSAMATGSTGIRGSWCSSRWKSYVWCWQLVTMPKY
jgi:hypothetical protein